MILPAVMKGLKSAGKHVLSEVLSGGDSHQGDDIILNAINNHPKARNHSLSKAAKLDIVKNAVNEAVLAPPSSGGIHLGGNHVPIISGTDNSVAQESTLTNQFGMTNLNKNDPFSEFASDAVKLKGVEYLGSVSVPSGSDVGSTIFQLDFNPIRWYKTRLAKYASLFNYYRFIKVEVIYEPIVSKMTPGSFCAAILPNVARQVPGAGVDGVRATMELKNAIMFPVYQVQSLTYAFTTPTQPLLCVPGTNPINDLQRTLTDQGKLFFKSAVGGMGVTSYGQVVVKYEIALYDSCIGDTPSAPPTVPYTLSLVGDTYGRLAVSTATWITAVSYTRFYNAYFANDVTMSDGTKVYALRNYIMVVYAGSTGAGSPLYCTLQDALVGPSAGIPCTPTATGGPVLLVTDIVSSTVYTMVKDALGVETPANNSIPKVKDAAPLKAATKGYFG